MQKKKYTTISVSQETFQEIKKLCPKISYDEFIRELLELKKEKMREGSHV